MKETGRSLWQLLLLRCDANTPVNLTCEECFVLLEYDVDLLANGAALDEILPAASYHLSLCSECKAKINEWLKDLSEGGTARDSRDRMRRR